MRAIIANATKVGTDIKAIRYHTYLGHCYMLNKVGNMDHLPVPVILTTRLDENTGFYSSDVWPKTCSRTGTYDHKNNMWLLATPLLPLLGKRVAITGLVSGAQQMYVSTSIDFNGREGLVVSFIPCAPMRSSYTQPRVRRSRPSKPW